MPSSRRDFLQATAASGAVAVASRFPSFAQSVPSSQIAQDPLRPQFHLLPRRNWMNDPNGPIFWNGNYHMFFQYNPNAAVWGDMHWAHAVSPDMIHWQHLPVALSPTPGGPDQDGCFSGSAVLHEGVPTFLFTGVKAVASPDATLRDGTHNFLETQCLATSSESDLKTLHKLPSPVLLPPHDPQLTGFRDPCLFRDEDAWFMGVGSGQRGKGGNVLLYRSTDLRTWQYLHPLTSGKSNGKQTPDSVDSGEMWECPDFFPLGGKFVLLYSTERRVFWQVGEFDRKELVFHCEEQGRLDCGSYYAPKSQVDASGRRILWGWIPETRPEAEFRACGWAGCMSLPRVLVLGLDNRLNMAFLPELVALRAKGFSSPSQHPALSEVACEIELQAKRAPFALAFTCNSELICPIVFDPAKNSAELRVADKSLAVPLTSSGEHKFHLYLDASVVECLVDHSAALTTRIYNVPKGPISVRMAGKDLQPLSSFNIWEMKAISKNRLTT